VGLQQRLAEVRGLYKGVVGAATGAGIIIGTYFAFYSTTKNFLRQHSSLHEGENLSLWMLLCCARSGEGALSVDEYSFSSQVAE
jgi:hypothetical protein